ncbi:MAG TPA: DUF4235 domain-containing protein [Jatrophihabitantaceae bacterium]|jgi:hypothetical protein
MANIVGKIGWRITTLAVGIPVGIAVKKGVDRAWAAARPDKPPRGAKDPDASWGDAIGWAVLSGAGVAIAQLATTKGATTLWRKLVGAEPPPFEKAKAGKADGEEDAEA